MYCREFVKKSIVTGHNEVVAKVMFLHVCVILFTGGVSRQGEPSVQGELPLGRENPPSGAGRTPKSRHPPGQGEPPRAGRTPRQGESPRSRHPPRADTPPEADPPVKHTPAYGQRAAGTHPTGMHSCSYLNSILGSSFGQGNDRPRQCHFWME